MAYKKYIEKNGKIYGPYVYHSRRVGGKVISEYHGIKKEEKKNRKKLIIVLGTILFLFLISWIIFFSIQFSGRVILNIEENYQEGEVIQGKINFELKQGELLPYDTKIIIENAENFYEFNLSDLVDTNPTEGKYFIEKIELTGEGKGYGIAGQKEIIPPVFFKLNITSKKQNKTEEESTPIEENQTEEITEEPIEEITEEESTPIEENQTEEIIEESPTPITGNVINSLPLFFRRILTGKIIEEEIQGDVSKNNPTEYNIPENSNIEIISGSVKTEEKELPEDILNINIENNKVIISTNYSEIIEGFGEEYLEEEIKIFPINLNDLNISLEEGDITIKMIYQEKEIYSIQDQISPEQPTEEPTEEEPKPLENITNETQPITNETNFTIEEINISIENITIDLTFEQINLTEKEKQLLKDEIGLVIVQTKVNIYKNKFNVIFTLGDYTMEHHYNINLNETDFKKQIDRDRIIWLKDLTNKFSEETYLTERREDLDENYTVM